MKHRFLALAQALMVCLSLFSVIAQAADGTISLDKGVYSPNETIIVQVSGITEKMVDDEAYVSIYEKGAPHTEYMDWLRPEAGDGQLEFDAPSQPGLYEMRLYNEDYKYTDDTLVMSVPFTVVLEKQGKISLEKSAYQANQYITVKVSGITEEMEKSQAYVSIFKKGAKHDEWGVFQYLKAGESTVQLMAPNLNGEFEMRLYSINHNYTDESFIMSIPFTLSGAEKGNSSTWAETTLEKAEGLGLVPDILKGADMTRPITRKEFAAVCVKLYERLSGNVATPASVNPFTDTKDAEVLKAYNVDITSGISTDKFGPDIILNREQAATMLTRVFKKVFVQGWTLKGDGNYTFNYPMPEKFADDDKISDWAKPSVYFMVHHKIISGVGNNTFAPRAITAAEQAQGYASATREQALAISLRIAENLGDGAAASQIMNKNAQPSSQSNETIVGTWKKGDTGYRYNAVTGRFEFDMYEMGLSGTSLEYTFNADGTFIENIKSSLGSETKITGNYTISGDKITFTYKSSEATVDSGKTWTAGEIPSPDSHYYEIDTSDSVTYLLMGLKDATLPLNTESNAIRLTLMD